MTTHTNLTIRGRILRLAAGNFGFILAEGDNPRQHPPHFFHANDCPGFHLLRIGQAVEFESTTSPKGLVAKNVHVIQER